MKKEKRHISSPLSIRKRDDGEDTRRIEGYALVFNSRSEDLGGFVEIISPEALDGVLERSDVLALLNHNAERGVLARFRNNGGSLELTVDEKGLRYSFDAPNTALGDEVLEGVRRGDISGSSFAFTVRDEQWTEEEEGRYLRTIRGFDQLFDVSPVYHPAYAETSVDTRGLDELKAGVKVRSDEDSEDKEEKSEEEDSEKKEPDKDEDTQEKSKDEDSEDKEEKSEESEEIEDEDEDKRNNEEKQNITINRTMSKPKKKFSLLSTIRSVVDRSKFDDASIYAIEQGKEAARAAGVNCQGDIQLAYEPEKEQRFEDAAAGILASQNPEAEGYGGEDVPTELLDLLGPLEEQLVVTQLGARLLNLKGNVEIPFYGGATSEWESEIGEAKDNNPKFKTIKMSPKRLATSLDISKQFLIQTDARSEALIRQNLINSIYLKLQRTMFGDGAGSDVEPVGLLHGVTAETAGFKYSDPIDWEEELEEANIIGDKKYVIAPSTKAILRATKVDAGSGRFVMENNDIYGISALSTGSMVKKGLILGDWSEFYLASFGALDLTVDTTTRAKFGQIRLVINTWWDYITVRPEAFIKKILK